MSCVRASLPVGGVFPTVPCTGRLAVALRGAWVRMDDLEKGHSLEVMSLGVKVGFS